VKTKPAIRGGLKSGRRYLEGLQTRLKFSLSMT